MAGEFDDLVPQDAGEFSDLIPDYSGEFEDLIKKKKPTHKFTDEELKKMALESGLPAPTGEPEKELDLLLRPLEVAFAPLTALRASYVAGKEKQLKGASILEQLEAMKDWFGAGLGEWSRPLGEEPMSPKISNVLGLTGAKGLASDIFLDPTTYMMGGGLKSLISRFNKTSKITEGMKAAQATKDFEIGEKVLTPTFRSVGKKGVTLSPTEQILPDVIEGAGIRSNLPAVVAGESPRVVDDLTRTLVTVLEKKKQSISPESLMGTTHAEWKLGRKGLKVFQSVDDKTGENIFRLAEEKQPSKVYAEMALKEHPDKNLLELDWLNIDKNGIDITKRREYRTGKPVEAIPGLYKEIHHKLEMYARDKGYSAIGTNPMSGGKERLYRMGYSEVAPDLMGEVPYTMVKRVEQNINFQHPDFWKKYRGLEIFEKHGADAQNRSMNIWNKSYVRNMNFDMDSSGKFIFYDKYLQPIQKFDKIDEAERFIDSVPILKSDYWAFKKHDFNTAEQLYKLTNDMYYHRIVEQSGKELTSMYKVGVGAKETPTTLETYRKFVSPETIQKIARGGEGIKQKIAAGAMEDAKAVFDVGTGETVAVSANIPIKESVMSTLSKMHDTPNDFYHRILTGKGWLTPALQFFERQGNDVKELFYRRIKVAEKREAQEIKNIKNEVDEMRSRLGIGKKEDVRIGDYAIAQDPIGRATLEKSMMKVVPELTENEMKMYQFYRAKYEEFFTRVNETRTFAGKDPIQYRGDYFTFFRNNDELEKLGYFLNEPEFSKKYEDFVHKISTAFQHEKLRKGGFIPLEENSKDIFLRYMNSAVHHIHMTPPIAINRALIKKFEVGGKVFDLQNKAPYFHAWVERWLDDIAGQTGVPTLFERGARKLNTNITYAFLSYNIRSALIQPTAIVNSFAELGPKFTTIGIKDWMSDANKAIKKSNVLSTREYDQSVSEAFKMVREPGYFTKLIENLTGVESLYGKTKLSKGEEALLKTTFGLRSASRMYGGGKEAVARVGMMPLQILDMQTAKITWNGAYRKAKDYMKLGEEAAINYADDMVTRTQGSGKISDLAQAQRSTVGKTILMLQTFVNNNWSFLMRDVLGVSNPQLKNKERFEKVFKLLLGINLTNFVFEDVMGTYSPFPTPIRKYMEERQEGTSPLKAGILGLKELAEVIPGIGGAIRYGSHPLGPLSEVLGMYPEYFAGKPGTGKIEYGLGATFGVPATSQIKKIIAGEKKGAGFIGSMLGIKNPQKKPKKGKLDLSDVENLGELNID